jgi:hypothetical protein
MVYDPSQTLTKSPINIRDIIPVRRIGNQLVQNCSKPTQWEWTET